MTLLSMRGITKTYGEGEAETRVLRGVDLDLERGEITALEGPSGSGKSTLLSILGTLMRPTSGHHEMLGVDLTRASEADLTQFRNRHIGFVFQFHHLLPDFSALENVVFPAALSAGRERRVDLARAQELLVRVGLGHRLSYRAGELSGGQKQRVAIARALMMKPDLVLADEPTGNLDRESALQVMELLAEINQEERMTFLISTHDEKIAAACGQRIYVQQGQAFRQP